MGSFPTLLHPIGRNPAGLILCVDSILQIPSSLRKDGVSEAVVKLLASSSGDGTSSGGDILKIEDGSGSDKRAITKLISHPVVRLK